MKIYWTNESLSAISIILEYIAKDNVSASIALVDSILNRVEEVLVDNPKAGRPGRVDETRELVVHASYIVVYRIKSNSIEILTVRHTARLWPDKF